MTFEKAKVVKAAEKFLSQGKINAAIKEYRQIIEHDQDDLTALNMLGDLLARAGEKGEAVTCFTRIAEYYREQEFTLKAIAMYRKIEKLKPRDLETAAQLAELYAAQGLIVDARAQYLIVAEAYTGEGKTKETLRVLHKIADLDPQNTDVRLKLAEGYLKEEMHAEAARAFCEVAGRMHEKGNLEQSLEAYSRALELRPWDKSVLSGLVSVHSALGTPEDAVELLEEALVAHPEDHDLLEMLAEACIQGEDATGAERAIAQLVSEDASDYRRYIDVVRLNIALGKASAAARVLGLIAEPMLSSREEVALVELVNELLETEPEQVDGLRLLARIHWWQRDMEKLRSVLERMAESAEAAGLTEDERYALTQLVRLAPDERRFIDRLDEIGGSLEEISEGSQIDGPAITEVPVFEEFTLVDDSLVEASSPEVVENPDLEFEWNSIAQASTPDANASFADLNEPDEVIATEVRVDSEGVSSPVLTQEFEFGESSEQITEQEETGASRTRAMMQQELESVDFYINQGYSDIAIDTLELLEREFGPHAEIDSRRAKLKAGAQSGKVSAQETGRADRPAQGATHHQAPAAAASGIDSGLAEIFEEFRIEAEGDDQAFSNEDYETHYNMATAYREMDLLDEAIREYQAAAGLTSPADGTVSYFQCCNMLGQCFMEKGLPQAAVLWFKKGIETPGRSEEEYVALQYELGSAYEQMGDLKQARAAFTDVYGVDVSYRDIAQRLDNLKARQKGKKK